MNQFELYRTLRRLSPDEQSGFLEQLGFSVEQSVDYLEAMSPNVKRQRQDMADKTLLNVYR